MIGWSLSALAFLLLPGWALYGIFTRKAPKFIDKVKESLRPTHEWGPKDPKLRAEWEIYKTKEMTKYCTRKYNTFLNHYNFKTPSLTLE